MIFTMDLTFALGLNMRGAWLNRDLWHQEVRRGSPTFSFRLIRTSQVSGSMYQPHLIVDD
jgi:hypothetical protein